MIDTYCHREELEDWVEQDKDGEQEISTDTEAAQTMDYLLVGDPVASASLQVEMHETLALATTPRSEEHKYYYDSDVEYPDISERVVEWKAARQATAPLPSWHPSNFGKVEHVCYNREPDLREVLNKPGRTGWQPIIQCNKSLH